MSLLANDARIDELRAAIDEMLSETKTYARIRDAISNQTGGGGVWAERLNTFFCSLPTLARARARSNRRRGVGDASTRATLARLVAAVEKSPVPELLPGRSARAFLKAVRRVADSCARCVGSHADRRLRQRWHLSLSLSLSIQPYRRVRRRRRRADEWRGAGAARGNPRRAGVDT